MSAEDQAGEFERCLAAGGVAVFPADTVYGVACDPDNRFAVQRLYLMKRRPLDKPSAVMFFDAEAAFTALPEIGPRTRGALARLLPGGVTALLPNPARRFPLACGNDPSTLGLRVPIVEQLAGVRRPVLQSSANRAGGADPRRLDEVPELIRSAADLVIDGGELPGTPSTVIDLMKFEDVGAWKVIRAGAVSEESLASALGWQYHFDPATYLETMRSELPAYDRIQDELASVSGTGARRILELGTGTGQTAARLLRRHPDASLVGIDSSEEMLAAARQILPAERVQLQVGRLQDALPDGPFDLVASALCIHHLDARQKADLFRRVRAVLDPHGRFVIADVIEPDDPREARVPLTPGFDKPSPLGSQLLWLADAGFTARASWVVADLAVMVAELAG